MNGVLTANSQVTKFANRAAQAEQIRPGEVVLANVTGVRATQFLVPDEVELALCQADLEFLASLGTCKHQGNPVKTLKGEIKGIKVPRLGRVDLRNVQVSWNGNFQIESTPQTRVVVY